MKKIVIILSCLALLACGIENKYKELELREINIIFSNEEDIFVETLSDNGVLYISKIQLQKLIDELEWFKNISEKGNNLYYESDDYIYTVNFGKGIIKKEIPKDKLELIEKNNNIEKEFEYLYDKKINEKKIKTIIYRDNIYANLYQIMDAKTLNFFKVDKENNHYAIDSKDFMDIDIPIFYKNEKINEFTYDIVHEYSYKLQKLALISKEDLLYLEKNKDKIMKNSYKELKKYSDFVNKKHFFIGAKNPMMIVSKEENVCENLKFASTFALSPINRNVIESKIIEQKIAYIKLKSFKGISTNEMEEILSPLFKIENIILDLRDNGGGLEINEKYLLNMFGEKVYKYYKTLEGNKKLEIPRKTDTLYKGNLIVLVNRNSFSASNGFANSVKLNKLGKIIGEKTGGLADHLQMLILPNGMIMTESTFVLETDSEFNHINNGVEADIFIEDKAIRGNNDPIFTKALEEIKKKS